MRLNSRKLKRLNCMNRVQTLVLLVLMAGFVWLTGRWVIGDGLGVFAGLFVILLMLFNPAFSPPVILRAYRATPITATDAPELHHALHVLSQRAGLEEPPSLHYLPTGTMNAFAMGLQGSASIALSDGLLRRLTFEEIVGVLAHEISHIRHNDMFIMATADLMGQMARLLSMTAMTLVVLSLPLILLGGVLIQWTPLLIVLSAPIWSALIQLAVSRKREFLADLSAAELMGQPDPLIRALAKLERQNSYWERFYRASSDNALLRTHPTTQERIQQLTSIAVQPTWERLTVPGQIQSPWLTHPAVPPRRISRYFWF